MEFRFPVIRATSITSGAFLPHNRHISVEQQSNFAARSLLSGSVRFEVVFIAAKISNDSRADAARCFVVKVKGYSEQLNTNLGDKQVMYEEGIKFCIHWVSFEHFKFDQIILSED